MLSDKTQHCAVGERRPVEFIYTNSLSLSFPLYPFSHSPILPFSPSPILPFSPSPLLPFSHSPILPFSHSLTPYSLHSLPHSLTPSLISLTLPALHPQVTNHPQHPRTHAVINHIPSHTPISSLLALIRFMARTFASYTHIRTHQPSCQWSISFLFCSRLIFFFFFFLRGRGVVWWVGLWLCVYVCMYIFLYVCM
ncbi:hypothetical protein IWX48DRAFT_456517 [Phyllosticta citricarpa]